jgi:hypothetical protein
MPHIIFLILVIIGIVYGMFQFFLYLIKSLMMVDERFVEKVKETDSELLNNFLDDEFDENTSDKQKSKIKKINRALRFDVFIGMLLAVCWFFYPFMLIQLQEADIAKISPTDKYLGKWLALMVLAGNIISYRFIKLGKLFSKQYILLVKLLCAILVLITTVIIVINTKKLYISNIISITLTSLWLSNSAVGLLLSHKS